MIGVCLSLGEVFLKDATRPILRLRPLTTLAKEIDLRCIGGELLGMKRDIKLNARDIVGGVVLVVFERLRRGDLERGRLPFRCQPVGGVGGLMVVAPKIGVCIG